MELMRPVSSDRSDPGSGWFFEPIFDGTRAIATLEESELTLFADGERPIEHGHSEIERALVRAGPGRFAVDGFILAVDPDRDGGERLRQPEEDRLGDSNRSPDLRECFVVLDFLWMEGVDLRPLPFVQRRRLLRALFDFSTPVVLCGSASSEPIEVVLRRAESEGWRGVVAKYGRSPYVSGVSADWRVCRFNEG